jgi:hypothetical protein
MSVRKVGHRLGKYDLIIDHQWHLVRHRAGYFAFQVATDYDSRQSVQGRVRHASPSLTCIRLSDWLFQTF